MTNVLQKGTVVIVALSLLMLGIVPFVASGQTTPRPDPVQIDNVEGFFGILESITNLLYTLFFIIAVIMFIWAAFLYLTASGNEDQMGRAKNILIYGVIAIIVAVLAWSIPNIVAGLFA